MHVIRSLVIAFSTYSRIPMPQVDWADENRRYVMCFFPLIGAAAGLLLWGWLWLCEALSVGLFCKGAVGALIPLAVTGGIHMDGLMDTSDALASCQSRERRLEILKDSHAGAFAVIACSTYLLLHAAVLSEAELWHAPALACVPVLSRAMSALSMSVFQHARPQGMLGGFAQAAHRRAVIASSAVYALLCCVVWLCLSVHLGAACILAASLCLLGYRRMAYRRFGGVTGDLAGWLVQIAELCLTAVIILGGKLR